MTVASLTVEMKREVWFVCTSLFVRHKYPHKQNWKTNEDGQEIDGRRGGLVSLLCIVRWGSGLLAENLAGDLAEQLEQEASNEVENDSQERIHIVVVLLQVGHVDVRHLVEQRSVMVERVFDPVGSLLCGRALEVLHSLGNLAGLVLVPVQSEQCKFDTVKDLIRGNALHILWVGEDLSDCGGQGGVSKSVTVDNDTHTTRGKLVHVVELVCEI